MSTPADSPPVVFITGASGGLGQALVAEFHHHGWRVAAGYHHQKCFKKSDVTLPLPLDVTNGEAAARAVNETVRQWGRLDVLVNNAGVTEDSLLAQMAEADWDRVLDVNLKGAFLCSQAAIRPMMKQRSGHIVNLSSFVARVGRAGQANYAAAKAGLIGLTESLAKEVGSRNIRVNAVLPGVLGTPMTAQLTTEQLAALADENALGRINTVEEVARFIVFLAGTQNISGQLFQLDSRVARWA